MTVDLRPATFQLDSLEVRLKVLLRFLAMNIFYLIIILGLTLGRVVLVDVTKKVILYIVFKILDRSNDQYTDWNR